MLNNPVYPATTVMELASMAAREHTAGNQRRATTTNAYLLLKGLTDAMELIAQLAPHGHTWTAEQKYLYGSFSKAASELADGLTDIVSLTADGEVRHV